jgi:hypothetical protein
MAPRRGVYSATVMNKRAKLIAAFGAFVTAGVDVAAVMLSVASIRIGT